MTVPESRPKAYRGLRARLQHEAVAWGFEPVSFDVFDRREIFLVTGLSFGVETA